MSDPWAELEEYLEHARKELVPKMPGSAFVMTLVPGGEPDLKFCLELGLAIMLEKPLIVAVSPGSHVPERLMQIAAAVVEVDMEDPSKGAQELGRVMARLKKELDL